MTLAHTLTTEQRRNATRRRHLSQLGLRSLTRDEFESFNPVRGPMAPLVGSEQEWYADARKNVLGILVLDRIDSDWSWVVLGRDQRGKFRAIDADVSVEDRDAARDALLERLLKRSRTGRRTFPQ